MLGTRWPIDRFCLLAILSILSVAAPGSLARAADAKTDHEQAAREAAELVRQLGDDS
jgi:hypothetical protein